MKAEERRLHNSITFRGQPSLLSPPLLLLLTCPPSPEQQATHRRNRRCRHEEKAGLYETMSIHRGLVGTWKVRKRHHMLQTASLSLPPLLPHIAYAVLSVQLMLISSYEHRDENDTEYMA
jgi:hypothetical protein